MSVEEKIKILQVICHLAQNPHTGVVLDRDGAPRLSGTFAGEMPLPSTRQTRLLPASPDTPTT